MILSWTSEAWEDYIYWQRNSKSILKRINELIKEVVRTPYEGKGKPEPLKHQLAGTWSRRIDQEHRLVYLIDDGEITILQCRYHY